MKQEKRSKLAKKQVKPEGEKAPSKMPLVNSKITKKVNEAQANLEAYFKKNKLDPSKDWTNDKKHGVKVRELVSILNVARDQVKGAAPKEIHHKKSEDKKKKSEAAGTRSTYDYPKVDGKEMTPDQKKRYRQQMRSGKTNEQALETAKASVKAPKASDKKPETSAKASTKPETPVKGKPEASGKKSSKKKLKNKVKPRKED